MNVYLNGLLESRASSDNGTGMSLRGSSCLWSLLSFSAPRPVRRVNFLCHTYLPWWTYSSPQVQEQESQLLGYLKSSEAWIKIRYSFLKLLPLARDKKKNKLLQCEKLFPKISQTFLQHFILMLQKGTVFLSKCLWPWCQVPYETQILITLERERLRH